MREEKITLYSFNELSQEAKETAIEKWREGTEWSIHNKEITESFKDYLDSLSLPTGDINWSLSYSQGDGVAFYGLIEGADMDDLMERILVEENKELYMKIRDLDYTITANIVRNSFGYHYSHFNTMSVEIDGDDIDTITEVLFEVEQDDEDYNDYYAKIENLFLEIQEAISHDIKCVSKSLEKQGYEEIEYIESDEHIIEVIDANDYEFTEDGVMY